MARRLFAALATTVVALFGYSAQAASSDRVSTYVAALARELATPPQQALHRIGDPARKLLAARGYLRADDTLMSRWSWSAAQIETHRSSNEYREMLAEVHAIKARFEARNPGFTLYANTDVRSFGVQLQRWNENRTVGAVAKELHRAAATHLRGNYPAKPDSAAVKRFAGFLREWVPPRAAPLAVPGLSLHGRSRALDFQVHKDGRIVAGPETATVSTIWEKRGWDRKLRLAVAPENGKFVGPLRAPNEPWHYEYVPAGDR